MNDNINNSNENNTNSPDMNCINNSTKETKTSSTFAIASFVLGVIALFSITTVIVPIICGSLAVIFAILSKGTNNKFSKNGYRGFWTGIASIAISITLLITTFYLIFYNQEYRAYINEQYTTHYGVSFDEYMDILQKAYNGEITEEDLQRMNIW